MALTSRAVHILLAVLLPTATLAQGVPVNDSGLTARDIVETGDRDADLALQRDKLAVKELLTAIEQEQIAVLRNILDAQTSFGGGQVAGMVSDLETGSGDADRAEDVDVLSYCELAAEVGHVEDGGGVFDRGDGVAQRDESIAMSEVVGVEVGQCQHGIRVATIGGDQRGEAGQRRPPDQMHVHYSQ